MSFLNPEVFYFIFIPFLLLFFILFNKKNTFEANFSKEMIKELTVSKEGLGKKTRNILFFLALLFMFFALARPVMNKVEHKINQEVNAIVLALDVSKSMRAQDLYPSRLEMAKLKLLKILENSKNNALGVIIFAKSSFILSPITQDFNSLEFIIKNFDTGLNFDNGSNIYSVLEASNKLFSKYKYKNIILLTDGGNKTSYDKEIKYLKENTLNVYTIALASNKATPIPNKNGFLTNSKGEIITITKNESIKELSFASKGAYVNYTLNDTDVKNVLNDIFTNIKKDKINAKKYEIYTELFYYPLAFALFLLFISFSSFPKKNLTVLILLSFFSSSSVKANLLEFVDINNAKEAYKNENYKESANLYKNIKNSQEAIYNQANSQYKNKNYKKALSLYNQIKSNENTILEYKKQHNLGNTYANLKNLQKAKEAYEKALKLKKNKQTQENLTLINKELEKKKKKEKKEKKKNKNKDQKNKKKNNKKDQKKNEKKDNKKDNKKNQKQDDKEKEKQNDKKNKEQQKNKEKQESKNKQNLKNKKDEISDLEEKKWLKKIGNKKVPILLKKVESTNQEDNSLTPW